MRRRSREWRPAGGRLVFRLHTSVAQSAACARRTGSPPSARASPRPANNLRERGGRRTRRIAMGPRVSLLLPRAVRQTTRTTSSIARNASRLTLWREEDDLALSLSPLTRFASTALAGWTATLDRFSGQHCVDKATCTLSRAVCGSGARRSDPSPSTDARFALASHQLQVRGALLDTSRNSPCRSRRSTRDQTERGRQARRAPRADP